MRRYKSYKDSGIDWLGDIPEDWIVKRVKDCSKNVKTGTTPSSSKGDFFYDGTETWYTPSDINNNTIVESSRKVTKNAFNQKELFLFPENSLYLIGIGGTLGKVGFSPIKASCNQQINVIEFNSKLVFPKFGFYQFLVIGNTLLKWSNYTTMPIFTQTSTKYLQILISPISEQIAIAQYLDAKTEAIDRKVNLLKQKIYGYKKLKNTIIAKAVTQGIKNEQLIVNDLEFKIAHSWSKCRLKDIGKLYSGLSGKSGDDFNQDDNPHNKGFIPFTNIANNVYLDKEHLGTVVINPEEKQNKIKKGDLFFLMSSEGYEDIGKTAVLGDEIEDAYLNSFCKGYRINQNKCNAFFLNYLLLSNIYRQRLIVEGKGFTRINLKMEKVTDFEVYIPKSLDEQQEIASYLDVKTKTIDKIIINIQKQINRLKALRKTLINDVVTGKIQVID